MNTQDLERFKKVPRNDILIYLHQNQLLGNEIKIRDIYDRINKPTSIFCLIIDDLIRIKFIECKNYISKKEDYSCLFPKFLENVEIKLTVAGNDYVESVLFNYNPSKYSQKENSEYIGMKDSGFHLKENFKKSFEEISEELKNCHLTDEDTKYRYFILTGINYKPDSEKKVFISYSHENEKHKNWVVNFAAKLNNHFSIEYDVNLKVQMSPKNYMEGNILGSDFVIIIFTPDYLNKTKAESETGVKYELSIIQQDLFRKISSGKYIPILKEGDKLSSIPEFMQDAIYADFRNEEQFEKNLKELVDLISN